MVKKMTLEEATRKFTKPDGTVEITEEILIIPPKRTKAIVNIAKAKEENGLK